MTGAWPHLTATHRLHSQQVSAPGLLVPKQLHCGPEGLALGTQLRPRFPQELLQEPPVPGQLFQRLLQGPGQVRSTLCGALGRGGDRQGLGERPDFGGPELSGEGGWYSRLWGGDEAQILPTCKANHLSPERDAGIQSSSIP